MGRGVGLRLGLGLGRGLWGWVSGIALTSFYIVLYFFPEYLGLVQGGDNKGIIALFDPLSRALFRCRHIRNQDIPNSFASNLVLSGPHRIQ